MSPRGGEQLFAGLTDAVANLAMAGKRVVLGSLEFRDRRAPGFPKPSTYPGVSLALDDVQRCRLSDGHRRQAYAL